MQRPLLSFLCDLCETSAPSALKLLLLLVLPMCSTIEQGGCITSGTLSCLEVTRDNEADDWNSFVMTAA